MVQKFKLSYLITMIVLAACGDDPVTESKDFGYDYQPLSVGSWIEYDVDSIHLNSFTVTADTYSFVMRDEIVEAMEDLEGRTAFRVRRTYTNADTADLFRKNYTRLITGVRAEVLEENIRSVNLTFPPVNGETWDANGFNTRDEQTYLYEYVDRSDQIMDQSFERTLRVIQENDTDNFVIRRFSEERYGRGVGLIFKEYFQVETQFDIDSGLHWIQTIRDYQIQ